MGLLRLLPKRVRVVTAVVQQDVSNIKMAFRSRRTRTYRSYSSHRWEGEETPTLVVELEIRLPKPMVGPAVLEFGDSGVILNISDPEMTILEAGIAAGVDLPYSCGLGGCGACAMVLQSGEVEYDDPEIICLTEADLAAGKCLTCVGKPRGHVVISDGSKS